MSTPAEKRDDSRAALEFGGLATGQARRAHAVREEIRALDDFQHASQRPHIPRDAIDKAVRAYVKAGGRELVGARIFENTKSVVR